MDPLIDAVDKGDFEIVKHLISTGVEYQINNIFTIASKNGHLNIVMYLHRELEADINCDDGLPVRFASFFGHFDVVMYLCENGATIESNYNSAVEWACQNGHLEIVKYLVNEMGADILNSNYCSLLWASEYGHLPVVKYLCEAGVDFQMYNELPIKRASQNGHYEVVKYLCELGADFRSDNDHTIRWASWSGHLPVVKYLCELGADIQSDDNYAIRKASDANHIEVVMYLYEKGADISKISEKHRKYILFCEKMKNKIKEKAQKKIYFWWIPICYSLTHHSGCGKRMMMKNVKKAQELGLDLID